MGVFLSLLCGVVALTFTEASVACRSLNAPLTFVTSRVPLVFLKNIYKGLESLDKQVFFHRFQMTAVVLVLFRSDEVKWSCMCVYIIFKCICVAWLGGCVGVIFYNGSVKSVEPEPKSVAQYTKNILLKSN